MFFYVIIFGILAILLVVAGLTAISRRGRQSTSAGGQTHGPARDTSRRNQKAARAQSRHDRRKRH
jgi:hypothetical protein